MPASAVTAAPRGSRQQARAASRRLSANMEDYLETIYCLAQEHGVSRVSSIAAAMGVKKPSVSKALKRLQRDGLVAHAPYGGATVTPRGREVAQAQVKSHRALTRFLMEVLALEPELAEHEACQMEHSISHVTVERLVKFIDFLGKNGRATASRFQRELRQEDTAARRETALRSWTSRV